MMANTEVLAVDPLTTTAFTDPTSIQAAALANLGGYLTSTSTLLCAGDCSRQSVTCLFRLARTRGLLLAQ